MANVGERLPIQHGNEKRKSTVGLRGEMNIGKVRCIVSRKQLSPDVIRATILARYHRLSYRNAVSLAYRFSKNNFRMISYPTLKEAITLHSVP